MIRGMGGHGPRQHAAGSRSTAALHVWAAGLAVALFGLAPIGRAGAQTSGSAQVGQNGTTANSDGGDAAGQQPGGSPTAASGRGAARGPGFVGGRGPGFIAGRGGPYGQLNYGRNGIFGAYGFQNVVPGAALDPQWSGLIEQNFSIMRATSPFPNRFAGGVYNPPRFGHHFGAHVGGFYYPAYGSFAYGGYAIGLGSGYFDGYVPSVYSTYGSWYPPYLPMDRVYIIERDVVHDQPAADERRSNESPKLETEKSRSTDDADYYLSARSGETLDDALADIRHAWMNGDFTRLKSRLPGNGKVRIYLKGKYKYSVDASDFAQMTRDAMARIDTVSFTLDHVQKRSDDRMLATGKHVYDDPDHQKHEVYVSYGLVKEDGRWRITEAGSSTEPITAHGD